MISGMLLKVINSINMTHTQVVNFLITIIISFVYTSLRKKLEAAAKLKDCDLIGHWQRSIINHLYWCVASTPNGNSELIKAKWLSLDNHVHNVHKGHNDTFPDCAHGQLHGSDSKKKWFKRHKHSLIIVYYNVRSLLCSEFKYFRF